MLHEFKDIIDIEYLPARLRDLKWHITGFVDGDGSFPIILSPVPEKRYGWLIQPRFEVELRNNNDSLVMLKVMARSMSFSPRIFQGDEYFKLILTNRRTLIEKIIPFFEAYKPYLKSEDVALLKYTVESLETKKHLEDKGFKEIIVKVFSMPSDNEGRRKWSFSDIIKDEPTPQQKTITIPTLPEGADRRHYLAGFIDAEGALGYAVMPKTKTITPYLTITNSNTAVLQKLQQTIMCGNINTGRLQIYGMDNMKNKVVPFLDKYRLIAKRTTYRKFKEILNLTEDGRHKTDFDRIVTMIHSLNDRGILRDHTLSTYPKNWEGEDMVQHRKDVA